MIILVQFTAVVWSDVENEVYVLLASTVLLIASVFLIRNPKAADFVYAPRLRAYRGKERKAMRNFYVWGLTFLSSAFILWSLINLGKEFLGYDKPIPFPFP